MPCDYKRNRRYIDILLSRRSGTTLQLSSYQPHEYHPASTIVRVRDYIHLQSGSGLCRAAEPLSMSNPVTLDPTASMFVPDAPENLHGACSNSMLNPKAEPFVLTGFALFFD